MWYTYTYIHIHIYAYIISVSQAYFGSISIYRSPVLSASLPSQVATLRNNRVVRRVCKDLSVQFHKGLLGFSLICHILQSGAAVFTASSLRNNNKSFILTWRCMYHVCIRCFNASNSFGKVLFLPGKHQNWELPAQAHFWFGLKNVPYICVSSIGCEKRHMLSVLITVSCRFRCEKKKARRISIRTPDRGNYMRLWESLKYFSRVAGMSCWYLVNQIIAPI